MPPDHGFCVVRPPHNGLFGGENMARRRAH